MRSGAERDRDREREGEKSPKPTRSRAPPRTNPNTILMCIHSPYSCRSTPPPRPTTRFSSFVTPPRFHSCAFCAQVGVPVCMGRLRNLPPPPQYLALRLPCTFRLLHLRPPFEPPSFSLSIQSFCQRPKSQRWETRKTQTVRTTNHTHARTRSLPMSCIRPHHTLTRCPPPPSPSSHTRSHLDQPSLDPPTPHRKRSFLLHMCTLTTPHTDDNADTPPTHAPPRGGRECDTRTLKEKGVCCACLVVVTRAVSDAVVGVCPPRAHHGALKTLK